MQEVSLRLCLIMADAFFTLNGNVRAIGSIRRGAMHTSQFSGDGRTAMQELPYFGTDTPSGHVTPEEWTQFLSETVTPRFPEGLSTWQASGQWRSASGQIIHEPSYILNLVHLDDPVPNKAVQEIIAFCKSRFQQEAVLRVKTTVCKTL